MASSAGGSRLVQDSSASFERVATVVAIYKVALFWAERAKSDPHLYTAEEREQKLAALMAAEAMLLDITRDADQLPGASQQQLHILQNELLNQGMLFHIWLYLGNGVLMKQTHTRGQRPAQTSFHRHPTVTPAI